MITLSVIVGLWMLISLIIVLVEYIKYPSNGFIEVLLDRGFISFLGAFLGIMCIIAAIIMFSIFYLP